jgi:hypothetical protein
MARQGGKYVVTPDGKAERVEWTEPAPPATAAPAAPAEAAQPADDGATSKPRKKGA